MNIEPMKRIPKTREDFERNLNILREKIINDQMSMPPLMLGSLGRLRFLPNKRINFLTVNEGARLMANHIASIEDMDIDAEESKTKDG